MFSRAEEFYLLKYKVSDSYLQQVGLLAFQEASQAPSFQGQLPWEPRALKRYQKITFRSYEITGTNYFQEQKSYAFLGLRFVTNTCNRWDFQLFRRCHWCFLFRGKFLGSLRHLRDISKFTFVSYMTTRTKYYQEQMSYIFLNLRSRTNTCNWWNFLLFRSCHRHFLFRENLFGSLRHFEDISKYTFES